MGPAGGARLEVASQGTHINRSQLTRRPLCIGTLIYRKAACTHS